MHTAIQTARHNLKNVFGFSDFRPGQEAVVQALLAERPALAIFPTGGGKSLCYQLPALQLDGVTLVISPLIALMKDQVDALRELGVSAARLDSTLSLEEVHDIYDGMARGTLKLLYVAPERLGNEGFRVRLERTKIAMMAIDEAHCISSWGHNFRPDYLKIAAFARELGIKRVLALTATATPAVSADIREAFGISAADHVQTGFHRPNLTLRVHPCGAEEERLELLVERLRDQDGGPTIVYVTLQNTAERVAEALTRAGFSAAAYHAGMKDERRAQVQEGFMADTIPIVVATIAFGMGIDKPDIRGVYHVNLPKSLENYSQEIGRAGRDGRPSRCELLACPDDRVVLDNFSYGDTPTREALEGLVGELLGSGPEFSVSRYALSQKHDIRSLVVATVLTYLELDGVLEATGPFYSGYKLKFLTPQGQLLSSFDDARRAFLTDIFEAGTFGRTWLSLDVDAISADLNQPRERVIAAVGYLEQKGMVETKPSGLRHGYLRPNPVDQAEVVERLVARFARREVNDIARTQQILDFAAHPECLTQLLVGYFGEEIEPCGHCGPCLGEPVQPLPPISAAPIGPEEEKLIASVVAEGHAKLRHPRTLTRFLCGLWSPGLGGRNGLSRDKRFGALEDRPFLDVLTVVQQHSPR